VVFFGATFGLSDYLVVERLDEVSLVHVEHLLVQSLLLVAVCIRLCGILHRFVVPAHVLLHVELFHRHVEVSHISAVASLHRSPWDLVTRLHRRKHAPVAGRVCVALPGDAEWIVAVVAAAERRDGTVRP